MLAAVLCLLPLVELLIDIDRLPPLEVCQERMGFAWHCMKFRIAEVQFRGLSGHPLIEEARSLHRCWALAYLLRDWQAGRFPPLGMVLHYRAELRARLGDEDFYSGKMPPHVPWWRFRRIDP